MRILVLTNFYPPAAIGGMERSCESVTEGLRRRGHEVLVLTSRHQRSRYPQTRGVERRLHLEMSLAPFRPALDSFLFNRANLRRNREILRETVRRFNPDVVFVWGMWNLPRILAADAEDITGGRVLYRFADYWPNLPSQVKEYWNRPGRFFLTRALRHSLRPLALSLQKRLDDAQPSFPHTIFASKAVRDEFIKQGIRFSGGAVVYNGFDLSAFTRDDLSVKYAGVPLRNLLYVGRIKPEKGVHTAVEALGRLVNAEPRDNWMLTIAGGGSAGYMESLSQLGERLGVLDRIHFAGEIPFADVPSLYQQNSIVLVPSIWVEPFGRSVLEGMASGCVVVASRIGALVEIIDEPRTGFLFPSGDAEALAGCLRLLGGNREVIESVGVAARKRALEKFRPEIILDRIESALDECNAGQLLPRITDASVTT